MKVYEVMSQDWNDALNSIESNVYDSESFTNYADAVRCAKRLAKTHRYGAIDCYELKRSQCRDAEDMAIEWEYNRGHHLQWCEKYDATGQVPYVWIGDTPIWRWNQQGGAEDLKPRNNKKGRSTK